jgi:hypothetical protein
MQVGETITENNSSSCPDAAQYYGKIVNGVDRLLTIGAFRFPLSAKPVDHKPRSGSKSYLCVRTIFGGLHFLR